MLEFDELQNRFYNKRCELLWMLKLAHGYDQRPVTFIRYNPSAFKVKGKRFKIKGQDRAKLLLDLLRAGARNEYAGRFITVHYLFYNNNDDERLVQTFTFKDAGAYRAWVNERAPAY